MLQDGPLFDKFAEDEAHTNAIKDYIVPNETANLKTVPDEMLKDLERILNTTGAQDIERLCRRNVLKLNGRTI